LQDWGAWAVNVLDAEMFRLIDIDASRQRFLQQAIESPSVKMCHVVLLYRQIKTLPALFRSRAYDWHP
jgi:hypothetical protein